jgi:hypothetical protein
MAGTMNLLRARCPGDRLAYPPSGPMSFVAVAVISALAATAGTGVRVTVV